MTTWESLRPFDPALASAPCEQCGSANKWGPRVPRFTQSVFGAAGALAWPCRTCGHEIMSETKATTDKRAQ